MAHVLYGQLSKSQLSAYLKRVCLSPGLARERPSATLPLFVQLHEAHATTIPFETLSLHGTGTPACQLACTLSTS